jgi:hypothetical protein
MLNECHLKFSHLFLYVIFFIIFDRRLKLVENKYFDFLYIRKIITFE